MKKIKIKKFWEFVNENSEEFSRFFMLVDKAYESETDLGKMIADTRADLFEQIPIDTDIKNLEISNDVPVINFTENSDRVKKLISQKIFPKKNLYNLPEESEIVSDKVSFHKKFQKEKFVPATVFNIEDAKKLKFPVIAKPAQGKSAEGIQKFQSPEDLEKTKVKFDLFSEAIDIADEYRCFCFKKDILDLNKRVRKKGSEDFLKKASTKTL